jgi:hypothetical protein
VVTTGQYYCSCAQGMGGFGAGVDFNVTKGTSHTCWVWTGQTDQDAYGHTRCIYTTEGSGAGDATCATCKPRPGVPKVHLDEVGACPLQLEWYINWVKIGGSRLCSPVGMGFKAGWCECHDGIGWY